MDGLYITRKRKKWKFHHFNEWPNCWQVEDATKNIIAEFVDDKPLTVEIGAGTANIAVGLAALYPSQKFIACDIKSDRLYKGAKRALEQKLDNVRFLRTNIRQVGELFEPASVDTIWVTFPDPFPRKKSAKHRLTHAMFLDMYKKLLKPGGTLLFKTDNQKLFDWSVEQFEQKGWKIQEISRDLHASNPPDDYKITTSYEQKFMTNGPIYFLSAFAA